MRLHMADLAGQPVIVGAGVAGLMTALQLAPMRCVLVSAGPIDAPGSGATSSSILAQGGLAAAIGPDDDVALHLADTIAAGDGHCDAGAAARIIAAAPQAIERLLSLGARFDRDANGVQSPDPGAKAAATFTGIRGLPGSDAIPGAKVASTFAGIALGLEAAHSRRRILHAGGDSSGAEIMRTLIRAVRSAAHITLMEGVTASDIIVRDCAVAGVVLHGPEGAGVLPTGQIVLATGGIGGLYGCTTNPLASFGAGVALAARAGAAVADMEFVQFHPTALDLTSRSGAAPAPLVSEAVRGEGAVLINDRGERFLADTPGADLAPRDIVARAIWRQQQAGRQVFLDARQRPGSGFASRFPAITCLCAAAGLDPASDLLPVTPAAHYHMGGVAVDWRGRATLAGLWACGEVACTGLHGANRLASNSLVEALVCGAAVADDLAGAPASRKSLAMPDAVRPWPTPDPAPVRMLMDRHVGLQRDAIGLRAAIDGLAPLAFQAGAPSADPALVALFIAVAALQRTESRGAHCRADFPATATHSHQSPLLLADVQAHLPAHVDAPARFSPPRPVSPAPDYRPAAPVASRFTTKIAS